jgi:hypothetical protein
VIIDKARLWNGWFGSLGKLRLFRGWFGETEIAPVVPVPLESRFTFYYSKDDTEFVYDAQDLAFYPKARVTAFRHEYVEGEG